MKSISMFILVGFVALSVFGFAGMLSSAEMAHPDNTCLASLAQNGACPPPQFSFASALFHTNAFKVFSTSLISGLIAFISVALIASGFVAALVASLERGIATVAERLNQLVSRYSGLHELKLALVRFERSPSDI